MKRFYKILSFFFSHPIGKRKIIKTLYRFFSWQLLSRIKLFNPTFKYIEETRLYIHRGQTIAIGNYYVGLLEFEEMAFALHFLNEEDTFFDVGANIGVYSVLASGVCQSKTFAFEPVPDTFVKLKKNISLNKLEQKITALNIGLAEKSGSVFFTTDLDSKNHVLLEDELITKNFRVEVKSLDEFVDFQPSLLKIDVEGYEKFILLGSKAILSNEKLKAIIVEINNEGNRYHVEESDVHNILISNGFKAYNYFPFKRTFSETGAQTKKDNRIYIRDIDFVQNKIALSPKFKVFGLQI